MIAPTDPAAEICRLLRLAREAQIINDYCTARAEDIFVEGGLDADTVAEAESLAEAEIGLDAGVRAELDTAESLSDGELLDSEDDATRHALKLAADVLPAARAALQHAEAAQHALIQRGYADPSARTHAPSPVRGSASAGVGC